jgi:hypothetical protein
MSKNGSVRLACTVQLSMKEMLLDVTHVDTFKLHVIENNITNMQTSEVGETLGYPNLD